MNKEFHLGKLPWSSIVIYCVAILLSLLSIGNKVFQSFLIEQVSPLSFSIVYLTLITTPVVEGLLFDFKWHKNLSRIRKFTDALFAGVVFQLICLTNLVSLLILQSQEASLDMQGKIFLIFVFALVACSFCYATQVFFILPIRKKVSLLSEEDSSQKRENRILKRHIMFLSVWNFVTFGVLYSALMRPIFESLP